MFNERKERRAQNYRSENVRTKAQSRSKMKGYGRKNREEYSSANIGNRKKENTGLTHNKRK
jgi:hypothetical protein